MIFIAIQDVKDDTQSTIYYKKLVKLNYQLYWTMILYRLLDYLDMYRYINMCEYLCFVLIQTK